MTGVNQLHNWAMNNIVFGHMNIMPCTQKIRENNNMIIVLSIALGLSLAVILLGFWADCSAFTARINGANGLPILVAPVVSFLGSLAVAVTAWLFEGFDTLAGAMLFSVSYHIGFGGLLI